MKDLHWPGGRSLDSSRRKTSSSWVQVGSPKSICYLIYFMAAGRPSTSYIYLNISPNFHALTHPVQTTTLLPRLIYQNFYARFDLDTKLSAQFLASIPDLELLTRDPTRKIQENQMCKLTNRRKILPFLSGDSIRLEPKNRWRIRISVSETGLPAVKDEILHM